MKDKTDSSPEVLLRINEIIEIRENFALALVLKAEGSTPRKAGVRAVIFESGKIFGTLGGGLVEAQTQSRAIESCKSKIPFLFEVQLQGENRQDDDPICGGSMTILIDPNVEKHKETFKLAAEAIKNRKKGILLTTINQRENLSLDYQWYLHDSIPSETQFPGQEKIYSCIKSETSQLFAEGDQNSMNQKKIFVEPVIPRPLLVIAGGGHIGQALAVQANLIGFDIIVLDDRSEFTNPELFPKEAKTICGDIAKSLGEIRPDNETYIVIVTRGHKNDADALEVCIKKPFNYIGMIGSKRKIVLIRENFIQSGLSSPEEFDKVFTPIGLDIGAVTVPEIAVSIMAELIAVRRKDLVHEPFNRKVSK